MKNLASLKEFLSVPRQILIISHIRPDADAIGSSLGLYHFLTEKGHKASVVFPSEYPYYYGWFPGIDKTLNYLKDKTEIHKVIKTCEILFAVDFNQLKRMNELGKKVALLKVPKVLIDHHPDPEPVFDYLFYDMHVSSAAEKVYDFIELMDPSFVYNKQIAECLYAAIVSDSGSFKFPSVTPDTLRVAANLMDTGIDHTLIQRNLYDNFKESRLRLWGYCINEKLEIYRELKTGIISLNQEDLRKFSAKLADTENLVNFILSMEDIVVGVLVVELSDMVKLSFRSKGNFPVNKLASLYFNGGGHTNAAGGQTTLSLVDTISLLKEKIMEFEEFSD